MNALTKALADSQRSYYLAKASASSRVADTLMARGPSGITTHRPDLAQATEQYRHFTGWAYASIRPIAQRIAGQPIHVGRKRRSMRGAKAATVVEPFDSHPLLDLLADPNELMVAWSVMYTTVASLELTGRQLWWLPDAKQIFPIPTSWITAFQGTTRFASFAIRPPGHAGDPWLLPAEECCYFSYPHPGDPHGAISPLMAAASAVNTDEAICVSQASAFRRGIHPTHAVIVGKGPDKQRPTLTGAQQRQIIDAIRKRYSDVHNSGEPLILDGLIEDVKRLSSTPSEMNWLESSQLTKSRITQIFGTNPIIMGELEGANRASATAADQHFCAFTVNPKIELMSQCLTEWLRPMFGGDDLVVWIEPAVSDDDEMSLKRMDLCAKYGALTTNELREFCGLPPADEFDGTLVGGRQMSLANALEDAVQHSLAGIEANRLMDMVRTPSRNGKH